MPALVWSLHLNAQKRGEMKRQGRRLRLSHGALTHSVGIHAQAQEVRDDGETISS
jgi:hypothetical protein